MGRGIVKLRDPRDDKDWYVEWSTVVDAPVTYLLTREQLREVIGSRYGTEGLAALGERMDRADATGTSFLDRTGADMIAGNRAGQNEECLSLTEIIDQYKEPM